MNPVSLIWVATSESLCDLVQILLGFHKPRRFHGLLLCFSAALFNWTVLVMRLRLDSRSGYVMADDLDDMETELDCGLGRRYPPVSVKKPRPQTL